MFTQYRYGNLHHLHVAVCVNGPGALPIKTPS